MTVTEFHGAVDGNCYDPANWTEGPPSDTNNRVIIAQSNKQLTGIDFQGSGDADIETFYAGGLFTGSIGTAMTALKFADFTAFPVGRADIDLSQAPAEQICNFHFLTCPMVVIHNCGANDHACYWSGGTYTYFFVHGGQSVRIASGVVISKLKVRHDASKPRPIVNIEAGASIGDLQIKGAIVNAYGDLGGTVVSGSGVLNLVGSSDVNIDSLRTYGGGQVNARGNGGTMLVVEASDQSLVDSETLSSRPWTFDETMLLGGTMRAKPVDVFTADPIVDGGRLYWTGNRVVVGPSDPS